MATPAVSCLWDLGQLFLIWFKYHYLLSRVANKGWGESEWRSGGGCLLAHASRGWGPGTAALGQWLWVGGQWPGAIVPRAVCGGDRDRRGAPGPAGARPGRRSRHSGPAPSEKPPRRPAQQPPQPTCWGNFFFTFSFLSRQTPWPVLWYMFQTAGVKNKIKSHSKGPAV